MSTKNTADTKAALVSRLNRIEGQIRGIKNMLDNEKCCMDVLIQVAAAKSALNSVGTLILETHIQECLQKAIEEGKCTAVVDELTNVIKRYIR
ncbi:MAG: metal-sensitive transcriptional regulator [Acetivibrionales bacterium]|jgi:DNA-binding FrmR family transcriptional regulator